MTGASGTHNLELGRSSRSSGVWTYYFYGLHLEALLRAGGPWIPE